MLMASSSLGQPRRDADNIDRAHVSEHRNGDGGRIRGRVHVDPSICGGRPHIRGTRVRVSDILDLLAGGAAESDILADYPYLNEADVRAAKIADRAVCD